MAFQRRCVICFCFFFLYFGDLRDLHSFPTRRSSDLALRDLRQVFSFLGLAAMPQHRSHGVHLRVAGRSEEHTSELQSLTNIVCRLLLEKKNVVPNHSCRLTDISSHCLNCSSIRRTSL